MKRHSVSFGSLSSSEDEADGSSTNVGGRISRSTESSRHETDGSGQIIVGSIPDVVVQRRDSSGLGDLGDGCKIDYRRESLGSLGTTLTRRGSAIDSYQTDFRRMSSLSALSNFQVNSIRVAAVSTTLISKQSMPAQKKCLQCHSL